MSQPARRRCCHCQKLTYKWQRVNGSAWHCYDGCFSTTGIDYRSVDGLPIWWDRKQKREFLKAEKAREKAATALKTKCDAFGEPVSAYDLSSHRGLRHTASEH